MKSAGQIMEKFDIGPEGLFSPPKRPNRLWEDSPCRPGLEGIEPGCGRRDLGPDLYYFDFDNVETSRYLEGISFTVFTGKISYRICSISSAPRLGNTRPPVPSDATEHLVAAFERYF